MKITRIRTRNFRQHRAIDIDLSSEQSDFVVIKGTMGAGKTNLLNAVTWALYGEVDDSNARQSQLLSDSVVIDLENDDYADVEVLVEVSLEAGKSAYISRKQSFKKKNEDVRPFGEPLLTVQVLNNLQDGFQVQPNPEHWIERNLPKRFRPYFLFDGEKLEKFFKDSDAPRIRAAIQEVAQIDVLFRMQEMLTNVSTELTQKAARLTGVDGERLSKALGDVSSEISRKEDEIRRFEAEILKAEELEQNLDKQLSGQGDLEANIDRKRQIDNALASKTRQLNNTQGDFAVKIREIAPVVLLSQALKQLGTQIEVARRNKVLPPPVDLQYLHALIDRGECICGSDLSHGSEHAKRLRNLIEEYSSVDAVGSALNEHSTIYQIELSKIPRYRELIDTLNSAIIEKSAEIEDLTNEQAALSDMLEGQDDEKIRLMAVSRREAREAAYRGSISCATSRSELSNLTLKKNDLEKQIEKAASTNSLAISAGKKAEFARKAAVTAKTLYEKMNNQVRNAVAGSLESQFQTMTWKKGYFSSIGIDEDFRVSVVNNRNIEVLNRLSAGERLCLAFAFSLTLSREAGLNFPIIVDTPMGRLAPEVQENLSRVLATATKGSDGAANHQIILLMTETEYNKRVANVLNDRRPKVLEIVFDPATSETSVA